MGGGGWWWGGSSAKREKKTSRISRSVSQAEHCSNHTLHVKLACDVPQEHVRPWIMAETDVSCPCTEGGGR